MVARASGSDCAQGASLSWIFGVPASCQGRTTGPPLCLWVDQMTPSKRALFVAAHKRGAATVQDGTPAVRTAAHRHEQRTGTDGKRTGTATAAPEETAGQPGVRRSFNEAAHKLGHWPMGPVEAAPGQGALRGDQGRPGRRARRGRPRRQGWSSPSARSASSSAISGPARCTPSTSSSTPTTRPPTPPWPGSTASPR